MNQSASTALPPLTVIPAGAGSGKTYTLQQQLGAWVCEGKVRPERIMAVTFTEAAAAELRERVSAELLHNGRAQDALRLDEAYISTIHGFGLRLLTEFAFDAGTSPAPRLLNDDEKDALIRHALARTDAADTVLANLARFGYRFDYRGSKSAEESFRDDVLSIVELLRSTGWQGYRETYARQGGEWIAARYGPTVNGDSLTNTLRQAVTRLLAAYPECLEAEHGNTPTAIKAFRADFRNLIEARKEGTLEAEWNLWKGLASLRLSKRGNGLPEDYDKLGLAVIEAAQQLHRHPGPLAQARAHSKALLETGQAVLVEYARAKREAGLVDYVDMIAMAASLLQDGSNGLDAIVDGVDCMVVDEFQDTNPLQFSLLWRMREAGVPTVVVGDLKQAIMGFQGADPRLFEALIAQHPAQTKPLTRNWRSRLPLVEFVNAIGPKLFGDAYIALQAQRDADDPARAKGPNGTDAAQAGAARAGLTPIDVISFAAAARKDGHAVRAFALGERLTALLADATVQIEDRHTKSDRRLRGGDIAVLCPTNPMLATYAGILRAQGLRVRLQADGWFASRIVQVAWHALAYLANPADRHAALYLSVTELGSRSLQSALAQLMDDGSIDEPLLASLDALAHDLVDRTVYAVVSNLLQTLGLYDAVASWPDGEQARADLLRLQAEAAEFMDANREALASGGFHGAGLETFLSWLAVRVEQKEGDRQPEPRVLDEHAIELTTWHSAKGREWSVVAVCGTERDVKAGLPAMGLGYDSFDELGRLLEHSRIEFAPAFASRTTNDRFLGELQAKADTEARRLLYVALTRARDKLVLEWPAYLAGKDRTTFWSLLAEHGGVELTGDALAIGGATFPCTIYHGAAEMPEDFDANSQPSSIVMPAVGRRAIKPGAAPLALTPDSRAPSVNPTALSTLSSEALQQAVYGPGLDGVTALTGAQLGTFLHRCFEILGARPDLSSVIERSTGVAVSETEIIQIAAAVGLFEDWTKTTLNAQATYREWPVLAQDEHGTIVSGSVDMIVETAQGVWVFDHKSDYTEDRLRAFGSYQAQLMGYAAALAGAERNVLGIAINWTRYGEVVWERTPSLVGGAG